MEVIFRRVIFTDDIAIVLFFIQVDILQSDSNFAHFITRLRNGVNIRAKIPGISIAGLLLGGAGHISVDDPIGLLCRRHCERA